MAEAVLANVSVRMRFNETSDLELNSTNFVETAVDRVLLKWTLPAIIFVGTVGNIMSIAVLIRSHMRSTSVYFYLTVLSFADLCVLYVSGFKTWIRLVTDFELLHVSNIVCKTTFFLLLFSLNFSAWLIVLTTVDRFIAVWFPFRAAVWCRAARARLLTVALTVVIAASNGHVFWTMRLQDGVAAKMPVHCGADTGSEFMNAPFEYLKLASYSMLPFAAILTLNVLIIVRLKWSDLVSSMRTYDDCSTTTAAAAASCNASLTLGRHAKITYMLLTVSFAYLLFTGPFTVFVLTTPRDVVEGNVRAKLMLVKAIFFLMMYSNHAVNFFLYCLTGRKFRYELREVFKSGWKKKKKNRMFSLYSPSTKTQPTHLEIELHEAAV